MAGGQSICIGVFIKPIAAELLWKRSTVMIALTVYTVTIASSGIFIGMLLDRYGPRLLLAFGGLFLGLGFYFSSMVESLVPFVLSFGFLRGLGFSCLFIPITVTITRSFDENRGLVLGIILAGAGIGGLLLTPLINYWIEASTWREAASLTGLLMFAVILPAAFFIRPHPSDASCDQSPSQETPSPSLMPDEDSTPDHTLRQALSSRYFWTYSLAANCIWIGILMVQMNLVPYATDSGISPATAALALGVSAAVNALARLAMGFLSDRIGTKNSIAISLVVGSASLFWLITVHSNWMLFVFAVFFGFAYGGFLPQHPRIIVELFGKKAMGSVMGVNNLCNALGPALGPFLGAALYDSRGSYTLAFIIGGTGILAGLACILTLPLPANQGGD